MKILIKYKNILFRLFSFASLYFLIAQPGVWAYLDASYQRTMSHNIQYIVSSIFNITGYGYNGDRSQLISGRYMQEILELFLKIIFGMKRGAIIFFLSYFCVNYFTTKAIFSKLIGDKYAYAGALMYTFNPLSLYMMNQVGFIYAYSAVPVIIFGCMQYFYIKDRNSVGLLMICLGTIFFTSYARFMLIYIIFFMLLGIFYYKDILLLISQKTRQSILAIGAIICTSLPFIFSFIYPHYSGESQYFAGMGNYATALKGWGSELYNAVKNIPLSKLIAPQEPTSNILGSLSNNNLFIYLSLGYFCFIIYFIFIKQVSLGKKEKKLLSVGITLITIGIVCRLLPYYVPETIFISISYDVLPFLASTSGFAYWFFIAGISILIPLSIQKASSKIGRFILYGLFIYCFSVISVLMNFNKNPKLGTIHIEEDDPIYKIIHGANIPSTQRPQGSIMYPSSHLLFNWAPYPVHIEYIPGVLPNIEGNERTTTDKQINLSKHISQQSKLGENLTNVGILTIGSFLVAQDIDNNDDKKQFDRYNNDDYIGLAKKADEFLSNYDKVVLTESNALYKKYEIKDLNLFSFLVYLPNSKIILSGYNNIFDTPLIFNNRPFLVDDVAYNRPGYIDSSYAIPNSNKQTISIKTRTGNPSSYYIKIGNVNPGQDILLQFNKTFNPSRKIKHISKEAYENLGCDESIYYPISKNAYCYLNSNFPTLKETLQVLSSKNYDNFDHFEGNIIGNAWVLRNIDNVDAEGNIYILIAYDKQYLFIITQAIAIIVLLLLVIGASISLKRYHKHENRIL